MINYTFFNSNKIISDSQSGFRPKHSVMTALTWSTDKIYRNIGNRKATTAVYLDLAKAFDTVNHALRLGKN